MVQLRRPYYHVGDHVTATTGHGTPWHGRITRVYTIPVHTPNRAKGTRQDWRYDVLVTSNQPEPAPGTTHTIQDGDMTLTERPHPDTSGYTPEPVNKPAPKPRCPFRDCHARPDCVVIYQTPRDEYGVILVRACLTHIAWAAKNMR